MRCRKPLANGRIIQILLIFSTVLSLGVNSSGCSDGSSSTPFSNPFETARTYFSSMDTMIVDVVYETGAEPYTGAGIVSGQLWDFLENNLRTVFRSRSGGMTFLVPKTLSQMRNIPAQNKNTWTSADILALATSIRQFSSTAYSSYFMVIFLNGYLDSGGAPNQRVIGVSIAGTTTVAIFKPVVRSAGDGEPSYVTRYVEQSTLVHEMGHALGFVNTGIPLTSDHQDSAHGAHCTNPNCVMYFENEGALDATKFVKQVIQTGNENIFGSECLADADAFHP